MKTKCFAHIDALRSGISRPHQELSFLATPQPRSSGAQVDAEQPDLFEQAPPDRETCTEWRRLRRSRTAGSRHHDRTKPSTPSISGKGSSPIHRGFALTPVRQNASAKVIGVRETTDCILIGSKPAGLEPYIVVSEQKNVSSELRHCPVPGVGESLPTFRNSADR